MAAKSTTLSLRRAAAIDAHSANLIGALKLLEKAQNNGESKEVIINHATRALESIDQIGHTLGPIRQQLEDLLAQRN